MRHYIMESVDGFIFWSFFQALAPMIWFFPLNDLELSGYEVFAVVWFFPVICGIPNLLKILQKKSVIFYLKVMIVASLVSFQTSTTIIRLVVLAYGLGISMLLFTVSLSHPEATVRQSYIRGLISGYFVLLCGRVWYGSFIPTWWNDTTNNVVIALGFISAFQDYYRPQFTTERNNSSSSLHKSDGLDVKNQDSDWKDTDVLKNNNISKGKSELDGPKHDPYNTNDLKYYPETFVLNNQKGNSKDLRPNWLLVSLGTGSLLFTTQWCFGEVSVITRWVVKGYPNTGPQPVPWGAPVLAALFIGVLISDFRISCSYLWWIIGPVAFASLYCLPTWYGYSGGLVLAVYIMSIWPRIIYSFTKCPPAKSAFIAMVVYIAEILFSVWTVAYNFVPGGIYTREQTGFLIGFILITILLALAANKERFDLFDVIGRNNMKAYKRWLFIVILLGGLGIGHRYNKMSNSLSKQKNLSMQFSSAIWTFHFGYDNAGWPSIERSAKFLEETQADVITVLESDASKTFLGNNDLTSWLSERLGMYVDFGPSTRDHTWGNMLLSKYPIIKSVHNLLPSPEGELAPSISATLNISGEFVDFVVVHMGNHADDLDRRLQSQFLANELRSSDNPVVFMGYITSHPGSRDYKHLIRNGVVKDIDFTDDERWCEYIMYRGLIRLGYARISHGGLSDTELQMAKFQIPENKTHFKDNRAITSNPGIPNKKVLFNSYFGDHHPYHWKTHQHHFHMNTPKYFLP